MRALAEFLMRGRLQAAGAGVVAAMLPLANWFSSAIVGLVVLRRGVKEGLFVLLWTSLPLVAWYGLNNDAMPLLVLFGTFIMGWILRETLSWELTLAATVVISAIAGLVFQVTSSQALAMLVDLYIEMVTAMQDMSRDQVTTLLVGNLALGHALLAVVMLMLARWWQSVLYNPGGFQKEIHELRLSPLMSGVIVSLMILAFVIDDPRFVRWLPLLTVPLMISGIGFVHWFVKKKNLTTAWLVSFYVLGLIMVQILYPLLASLAMLDSGLDLRKRIESDKPDNEE